MTESCAGVAPTVERFATLSSTQQRGVAPCHPGESSAWAGLTEGGAAEVTRPRVAEVQAGVRTGRVRGGGQGSTTNFTTAVRHQALVPVPLRSQHFPTEAPVVLGQRLHHHLTARAPPARLQGGGLGPLLDAAHMEYLNKNFVVELIVTKTEQYFLPGNSSDSPRLAGVV